MLCKLIEISKVMCTNYLKIASVKRHHCTHCRSLLHTICTEMLLTHSSIIFDLQKLRRNKFEKKYATHTAVKHF